MTMPCSLHPAPSPRPEPPSRPTWYSASPTAPAILRAIVSAQVQRPQTEKLQVAAGPLEERIDTAAPVVPASATRPAAWEAAFGILRQQAPEPATCFIHRDFQHFNLLWRRGRLTSVVDWARSCTGPADFDAGHCRLNLAVLFGADWAERLRLDYEAEAGRAIDPWWDLYAVTAYSDEWRRFIPVQVAGRAPVDTAGMTSRVEDLLEATLGRL
jgi:aminoglycoside phosphotransferase (APT) family kinase protein